MPLLLRLQELQGKDDAEWKKSVFASRLRGENAFVVVFSPVPVAAYSTSNKFLLVARHTLTTVPFKLALKPNRNHPITVDRREPYTV